MGERTKCLATAAWVTVLDAAVVMYYGNAVWKVLSGIIWSKLLLFLLAAVGQQHFSTCGSTRGPVCGSRFMDIG